MSKEEEHNHSWKIEDDNNNDEDNEDIRRRPSTTRRRGQEDEDISTWQPEAILTDLPPNAEDTMKSHVSDSHLSITNGDMTADSTLFTSTDDQVGFQMTDSIIQPTTTTTTITTTVPNPRRTIRAELVPDDEEMEARFAEQMEVQITQEVEERLTGKIVVATEIKKEETRTTRNCGGLKLSTLVILIVLLGIIAIGGTVGGIFFARSRDGDDHGHQSVQSGDNGPAGKPPSTNSVIMDELKVWIAPTEQDMVPFNDPTSPQSQALEWLESDSITLSEDRSTKTALQRYVFAVLYFATSGPNWYRPYLSSEDICTWNIGSTNDTTGAVCTIDDGIVDKIDMFDNNLTGTLPWKVALLTDLRHIAMDYNLIEGPNPSRIGELHQLEFFGMSHTRLSGTIPSVFPPSISVIDLSNNLLTGSIPTGWDILFPKLKYLSLAGDNPLRFWEYPLYGFENYGNSITGSVDSLFCQ